MIEQLIIIGSGPAGLTAAIYAARANLNPLLFEGFQEGGIPGGQLMITGVVENYPGFPEGVMGPELMGRMREQAEKLCGVRMVTEDIAEARISNGRPFTVVSQSGQEYGAKSLIIATGATANRLPLASEQRLWRRGISACAVCDGALPIFRDKPLAVIGGGETAISEAIHLTQYACRVYIIHRRDAFRASSTLCERAKSHAKIEILWNKTVEEFVGEARLTGLKLRDAVTGEFSNLEVAGAFEAIGHTPNVNFLKGQIETDQSGYIVTPFGSTATSVEGVFAAGDVSDPKFRQAITAAGKGCMAALEAESWLRK